MLGLLALQALGAQAQETTRVLSRESVVARYADAQSRFIDVDGVNVHYKDQGSGPALLLVHGTLGDLSDWDGWAALLAPHYRVLRLDLPSFGLTGPLPSANYAVDRMLALIDGFMDRVGAERFAIAGISYGGLVSFRYAATRTERVTALILANSAGIEYGRGPATAASAAAAGKPAASAASGANAPPTVAHNVFWDPVVSADDVAVNLRHMVVDEALITPAMVQRKLAFLNTRGRGEESVAGRRLYERGDPVRVLGHVRAPVLVLWGADNRALNPGTADDFVAALKKSCAAQRVMVAGAGHLLIVDQPLQSAQAALRFLDHPPAACAGAAVAAGAR